MICKPLLKDQPVRQPSYPPVDYWPEKTGISILDDGWPELVSVPPHIRRAIMVVVNYSVLWSFEQFANLPDKVVLQILEKLDRRTLNACSCTCKRMKALIKDIKKKPDPDLDAFYYMPQMNLMN